MRIIRLWPSIDRLLSDMSDNRRGVETQLLALLKRNEPLVAEVVRAAANVKDK